MTRTYLLFTALIGFTFMTPAFAMAQEKAAAPKEEAAPSKKADEKTEAKKDVQKVKKEEKKVELRQSPDKVKTQSAQTGPTGATKKWIDAENAMIDPLGKQDKGTILILRNKYSLINATRIVSRDVGAAVKSCGDKNPDLKKQMDDRYKQWTSAVHPILDTAEKQFKKDVEALKIVKPAEFRKVLELHDEAYEAAEKQVTKTPVTTAEACKGTLASMDRTEDNMIRILQETLLPESVIRKRAEDSEKAEAAAQKAGAKVGGSSKASE